MGFYPIFIDLQDKPVLVVGGGSVAYRKIETLLEYGAKVRVVSPKVIAEIQAIIDDNRCSWQEKKYAKEDLKDAVLVFSCTEQEAINAQVVQDARAENILINVVDDPQHCSFFVPSIMKRGDLCIAVSTTGSSPMVARLIREELEEIYGEEMRFYLDLLRTWRYKVKSVLSPDKRRKFWQEVTNGKVLTLIQNGEPEQAEEVINQCFQSLSD